jgi:hypothetical protein
MFSGSAEPSPASVSAPTTAAPLGEVYKGATPPNDGGNWLPKSWFTDPFALLDSLGLGYKASPSGLSYDTLRSMAENNTIIASIVQTRIGQISSFNRPQPNKYSVGYKVRHLDDKRRLRSFERDRIKELEHFILHCGFDDNLDRDSFDTYVKKIVRDRLYYDQMTTEVVLTAGRRPHSFFAVPASTIRLASPRKRKGTPMTVSETRDGVKFIQIIDGVIVNQYTAHEMAFSIANPRTDLRSFNYGYSELEMLIKTVTAHLWAEEWNRRLFTQGSMTKGILNLRGNIPPQQLESFKRNWLCAPGSARIYTRHGAETLSGVMAKQQCLEATGSGVVLSGTEPVEVWDGQEWVQATVHKVGKRRMAKLHLVTGETEVAGTEHRFLVAGSDGAVWKKLRDLTPADWVMLSATPLDAGTERSLHVTCRDPRAVPVHIDRIGADLWEVLGWLTGDGCIPGTGRSSVVLWFYHAAREASIARKHLRILRRYGLPAKLKTVKRPNPKHAAKIEIRVCQKALREALSQLGFGTAHGWKGSPEKTIPEAIFTETLENRRAFVRGLFSADGGKHTFKLQAAQLLLAAKSDGVRCPVQKLLATLGLASRHHVTPKKGLLYVQDPDRFVREVGFIQGYKNSLGKRKRCFQRADALAPAYTAWVAKQLRQSPGWSKFTRAEQVQTNAWSRGSSARSRLLVKSLVEKAGLHIPDLELRQCQVKGVTPTFMEEAYDLTVQTTSHRYVLDGFVTHNSQISGVSNAWRTPIINSNEEVQWIDLQPNNDDMGFEAWMNYLVKVACACYLIDPSEINFDMRAGVAQKPMFMSTNEAQQKLSQDKGLRPLLRHVEGHINRHLIRYYDPSYVWEYVGVDAKTEAEAIDLRLKELTSYKTLNEVREQEQLPPVPYGDVVPNPSYIGYRSQQELMLAQQQQPQAPDGQQQQGVPGFPGGSAPAVDQEPEERAVGDDLRYHLDESDKRVKRRVQDRYRQPSETEDWESTFNAALSRHDIKKAQAPFHDLVA